MRTDLTSSLQAPKRLFFALCLCILAGALYIAPTQHAHARGYMNREGGRRSVELEPHIGTHFHFDGIPDPGGVIGGRVHIPIVSSGLVPDFNDALYFGVGVDIYYTRGFGRWGLAFGIPVMLQYRMFLHPIFSLGIELGLNIYLHTVWFERPTFLLFDAAFLMGAFTFHLNITRSISILLRLGSPYTSVGASFSF